MRRQDYCTVSLLTSNLQLNNVNITIGLCTNIIKRHLTILIVNYWCLEWLGIAWEKTNYSMESYRTRDGLYQWFLRGIYQWFLKGLYIPNTKHHNFFEIQWNLLEFHRDKGKGETMVFKQLGVYSQMLVDAIWELM